MLQNLQLFCLILIYCNLNTFGDILLYKGDTYLCLVIIVSLCDEAHVWLGGAPSSHTPSKCGDTVGVKFSQAAAAPADGELCKTTHKPAGAAK